MSERRMFVLANAAVRRRVEQVIRDAPEGFVVTVKEPTRSLEANAAMWPILQAMSDQLTWPVNGEMVKMSPADWKDLTTAAFQNETGRIAKGLNGGVVMLGLRTSAMGKRRFSEYLDFLHACAAERGVVVYRDEVRT